MTERALASIMLDRPLDVVWTTIRDFDSYALWVGGIDETPLEGDVGGTTVGAVRRVNPDGVVRRQRLMALSDLEHSFSYEGCESLVLSDGSASRTMTSYVGTVRLQPITVGGGCLASWSADYVCDPADADFWASWWAGSLTTWLTSLRDHL